MATISLSFRGKLPSLLDQLLEENSKLFRAAIREWATYDLEAAIQNHLSDKTLRRRTGFLARETHFKSLNPKGKSSWIVTVATTVYGPVHEYGATITPRRRKWLTVPLPPAQTPAGVTRYKAPDYPGAFLIKTKKGKLFIVRKGKGHKLEFLFVLKKKVVIPARRWFTKAVKQARPKLERRLKVALHA